MGAWEIEELEPNGQSSWQKNPPPLEEDALLEEAIDKAREFVNDDLDAEEPTILRSAFARAKEFLRAHSREMKKRLAYFPPAPSITPGPNGSADLHWEQPAWALLVNIPAGDAFATFYGDAQGSGRIKGNLDPKVWNLGIITWLSKG
jgi:hypothetical protein